jgi:hypothetical protein
MQLSNWLELSENWRARATACVAAAQRIACNFTETMAYRAK